jgi:hypothetical protein
MTGALTCAPSIDRIIASAIWFDAAESFVAGAAAFVAGMPEFSNALKRFTNDGAVRVPFNGNRPPSAPSGSFADIAIAFTHC